MNKYQKSQANESRSLSDKVHALRRRRALYGETEYTKKLYNELIASLMNVTYYLPQQYLGLKEEDASDFVLFMYNRFDAIIASYREDADDFLAYYYSVLRTRIKSFYGKRSRMTRKETAVLHGHEFYQHYLKQQESDVMTAAEKAYQYYGRTLPAQASENAEKLLFIMRRSRAACRRIFILMLSIAPFIPVNELYDVCVILHYDIRQTLNLNAKLGTKSRDIINEAFLLESRRNLHWTKVLELESRILFESEADFDLEKPDLLILLENSRERFRNKSANLDKLVKRADYKDIGQVLGISKGTVTSSIYYARNLVSWLLLPQPGFVDQKKLGIAVSIINDIETGRWKKSAPNSELYEPYIMFPGAQRLC